jgi:hypothetical protein
MGDNERFTLCFNLFSFDKQTTPKVLWLSLLKGLRYGRNEKIHVQFLLSEFTGLVQKVPSPVKLSFRDFLKQIGIRFPSLNENGEAVLTPPT